MNQSFKELENLFRRADSSLVSDAMERCERIGVVSGLHRLTTMSRVSGTVATIQLGLVGEEPSDGPHLGASTLDEIGPGQVIVIANEGRTDAACWGGLLGHAARARDVAGIVADGAVRDRDELEALDLPVFARGTTPISARGRFVEVDRDVPVMISGIRVNPGDWVIADGTGVVFVPQEVAADVAAFLGELLEKEKEIVSRLDKGSRASELMGQEYERLLRSEP